VALRTNDGRDVLLRIFCVLVGNLLTTLSAGAQDATWLSNPGSNGFNVGSNWSTGTVPTGTATFGVSNTTTLFSPSLGQTFGGWTFTAGASAYTITLNPNSFNVIDQFVGAGVVIDGGSVSILNPGVFNAFNFANSSTAGGAQITNSGFLQFLNSSSAGTAAITNNEILSYSGSSSANHATIVNNVGMSFNGSSTAGNATIVNNSISGAFGLCFGCGPVPGLGFHDTSTAGNATITTDGGSTQFLDQSTGGNARFITILGFVDFSSTRGPNGDGKISAGSIEGTGNYAIGSNELTVGSNNLSTQVAAAILDGGTCLCLGGSLVKIGTGTLTLSGINTYSGATTVNGGTLSVNGSIASSSMTKVNAGGALSGNGTVGNTTINGGTLMPGNATPGSAMTVAGNLAFQSGSLYLVQLNPAASTFTSVTGTASLNGSVEAAFLPGSYLAKQYTIVSAAGGVNGTFGSVVSANLPSTLAATLSYDAHDAYLNVVLALSQLPGLNGNQRSVANTLSNFFNTNGGIAMAFATLAPAGLTQAAGETATGTQQTTFDAMNLFMGVLTDPFIDGRGNGVSVGGSAATGYASTQKTGAARDANAMFTKAMPAAPSFEQRWSVWAAGFGGSQTTDGNATLGSNSATSRIYGTAVGADYRFSPSTIAGFALAGGGTNFSVANAGTGRSDLFQAGAFVRHNVGPAYITAALAYGWQDVTTDRTVTVAGVDMLRARFNANAFSGRVEGGYRFVTPLMGITPYAAGQFTTFNLPAYAEGVLSGANTFALSYGAKSVTDTRSELGIRTDKSWAMTDSIFTLRGRFAWAHDYDPDRSIAATFQALPGASFVVNGAAQAHDSALTTASAEIKWINGWSAAATFEGEFSEVTRSYAGKGVVRYAW
jgi:autotransporter-associated beta strand protein